MKKIKGKLDGKSPFCLQDVKDAAAKQQEMLSALLDSSLDRWTQCNPDKNPATDCVVVVSLAFSYRLKMWGLESDRVIIVSPALNGTSCVCINAFN